jgi:hypothetical protein
MLSSFILTGCSQSPNFTYIATDKNFYLPNSSGQLIFSVHNYEGVSGYVDMHTLFIPSMCGDVAYADKSIPIELVGKSDTAYYVNFNIKNVPSCSELSPKICVYIETNAFVNSKCQNIYVAKNMDVNQ